MYFNFYIRLVSGLYFMFSHMLYNGSLFELIHTISFGGVFLVCGVSYFVGMVANICSKVWEKVFYSFVSELPTYWVMGENANDTKWIKIITPQQKKKLEAAFKRDSLLSLSELTENEFKKTSNKMRVFLLPNQLDRLTDYNLNFCLFRSLFMVNLFIMGSLIVLDDLVSLLIHLAFAIVFTFSMYKFSILYARELFLQYIHRSDDLERKG